MENYVVRYLPHEREAVIALLTRSNDIIINQIEPEAAHITIQLEDSEKAYHLLLDQIALEVRKPEVIQSQNPSVI